MFSFLKGLFKSGGKKHYDQEKKVLVEGSAEDRTRLARDAATHPEILFYLSKDKDPNVRLSVAMNRKTPIHASALLANDQSVDVRIALAARLVELLPDLSTEEHSQLYAYAAQALGVLAQDEVLKIRQALSSALKDHAKAPPKVVGQLARDIEREVSEPILRFCVALSDEDLLDILGGHPESWVLSAIASRPAVSDRVSDAVIDKKDIPASTLLINNVGAKLAEKSLQKIIDQAKDYPEWHEPLAARKEMSFSLVQQLAGFVSEKVLGVLEKRADFDHATRCEVAELVKRRVEFHHHDAPQETPESKVERFVKAGKLTANVLNDAMAWQDHKFVLLALAHLSKIHPVVIEKMLRAGSAKPIVALCWKAKMPMRVAMELQRSYARLSPKDFLYAKGGTDYPLTAAEIKWQLDFYGVDTSS